VQVQVQVRELRLVLRLVQQLVQQLEPVSPLVRQLRAFEKQSEEQQH
jgi:hypothetical protein